MSKDEKAQFVIYLMDDIKNKILQNIWNDKIPEEWSGIELRWLIADKMGNVVFGGFEKKNQRKRAKEFNNYVLINNL